MKYYTCVQVKKLHTSIIIQGIYVKKVFYNTIYNYDQVIDDS